MSFVPTQQIRISLEFGAGTVSVGRLAIRDNIIYFEYDSEFLLRGLEISPLRLPLSPELKTFDRHLFNGLPGVFNDSLPDGWGRLLLDRSVRAKGILPEQLTPLDRLAYVGNAGMGALVYEPNYSQQVSDKKIDLDVLATNALAVLAGKSDDVLLELLALNGSSAGARPKAMIGVDQLFQTIIHGKSQLPDGFSPWIVKFPNAQDGTDAGAIEYVYALMARDAGVAMTQTHLFSAQRGPGFFSTERFDRLHGKRLHAHTACGALESDFRNPSLDYEDLLALTSMLTRDVNEIGKMFSLAVFNVLAHNRDDHSKNFSFLMDEAGERTLSPAYDLTFSFGPGGEQSTMVMGEGKNPGIEHLRELGKGAGLSKQSVLSAIEQTRSALTQWEILARQYGVSKANISQIAQRLIR